MKKGSLVIFLLVMLFSSVTYTQVVREYGAKIGLASSTQSWQWPPWTGISTSVASRQSIDAGVFVEWLDIPVFSLLTEVHYVQKGSVGTSNVPPALTQFSHATNQYNTYSLWIDYLSVPVLAKLRWGLAPLSPYLILGPRFDIYLASTGTFLDHNFKAVDLGGTFGFGLEPSLQLPFHVAAEYRYSPTFRDSYSVTPLTLRNRSMEFLLVVAF